MKSLSILTKQQGIEGDTKFKGPGSLNKFWEFV